MLFSVGILPAFKCVLRTEFEYPHKHGSSWQAEWPAAERGRDCVSDINKLVAAILTAGRVPTMRPSYNPPEASDWLVEYNMWVETLDKQDAAREADISRSLVDSLASL